MYVLLAKRIHAANNNTVTSDDLVRFLQAIIAFFNLQFETKFGNGLVDQYGLNDQLCKNFLVLIVVESAHEAYVRVS